MDPSYVGQKDLLKKRDWVPAPKSLEPPPGFLPEKSQDETVTMNPNTKSLTDAVVNLMEQQQHKEIPDVMSHRGRGDVLNVLVAAGLVCKCRNGKDILYKALSMAQCVGSLIFRQPDNVWAAIEAKTKRIVFELPNGTSWNSEQFQKMSITSILFSNTPSFNYFMENVVDVDHCDAGVDCVW